MESNQESRSWHSDKPESKGDLDHTESARGHRGSGTKGDGDDHRASQHSPRHKPVESAVRPTLLPEGWTVFVNSLRQVQYSHVKTGMICFQIPENPEALNNFVFKDVLAASDQVDRKRKARSHPQSHTDKSERYDDHQRSWQYMENITSHTPVCWTDPLCLRNDPRRPTKTRTPENLL